jgi:hypothetical protein
MNGKVLDIGMRPACELNHQGLVLAEWGLRSPQCLSLFTMFETEVQHCVFIEINIEIVMEFKVPVLYCSPVVIVM